jgi:hypothetical protein
LQGATCARHGCIHLRRDSGRVKREAGTRSSGPGVPGCGKFSIAKDTPLSERTRLLCVQPVVRACDLLRPVNCRVGTFVRVPERLRYPTRLLS